MKVHVVYDESSGAVQALGVALPPNYDNSQPRSGPIAREGQRVATLQVPEEFETAPLHELTQTLVVDRTGQGLSLKKAD